MDYNAILAQVLALLQQERRLSYRVLKLRLQLDDDTLEALKEDLIYAKQLAVDEDGRVLVWRGGAGAVTAPGSGATEPVKPPHTRYLQTLVEQHEERWREAEVCRLRGILLLRQPGTPQAEAEAWLQRALDVARRQEANPWSCGPP
jgi:hypothetical protein